MTTLGISSNCRPELSARELAALAVSLGAEVVDLRAGRGQGWESDGVAPLIEAGITPVFVGISFVLGRPGRPETSPAAGDLPVKVFADEALATDPAARRLAADQARRLREHASLLVETHHGYASLPALLELCAETGARLLLDTLGLARLGADLPDAAEAVRPYVDACQVKGFDRADPGGRHRPLAAMGASYGQILRAAVPPGRPVLVESKSGTLADDLAVLRRWWNLEEA